jgi:hypothetical protein
MMALRTYSNKPAGNQSILADADNRFFLGSATCLIPSHRIAPYCLLAFVYINKVALAGDE